MGKSVILSFAVATLAIAPGIAFADDIIVVEPEVQTWVMEQPLPDAVYEGDVTVGTVLPDSVQVIEVPRYKKYRYAVINRHRVIVDTNTHKVIKIYE